jgi:hypothetical protein
MIQTGLSEVYREFASDLPPLGLPKIDAKRP